MWSLSFALVTVIFKLTASQCLPYNQPIFTEYIEISPSSPATTNVLCKNLASQIQDTALSQFRANSARVPIFGSLSEPLAQEICSCMSCPYCSKLNVSPNGYRKSLCPNSDVPKILNSGNVVKIVNQRQRGPECALANNVRNNYVNALKPVGINNGLVNVGADFLNSALNVASSLSSNMISKSNCALKANAPNVNNKYREIVAVVKSMPCNCGCGKQILV